MSLLVSAGVKTTIWLAYLLFVIAMAARGSPSPLDLIIGIVLSVTSVGQLALGAAYTHKQRTGLLDRGDYADLETGGEKDENKASLPRSKSWRESIPAISINSREWQRKHSSETDYESFRNSLIEAENRLYNQQGITTTLELAAETRTLASSNYDALTLAGPSPPQSPGLVTVLSHPPVKRAYSPADSTFREFEQADLALSGFYGGSKLEGETRRF